MEAARRRAPEGEGEGGGGGGGGGRPRQRSLLSRWRAATWKSGPAIPPLPTRAIAQRLSQRRDQAPHRGWPRPTGAALGPRPEVQRAHCRTLPPHPPGRPRAATAMAPRSPLCTTIPSKEVTAFSIELFVLAISAPDPAGITLATLRRTSSWLGTANAACSRAGATSDAAGTCNTTHTECVPCVAV